MKSFLGVFIFRAGFVSFSRKKCGEKIQDFRGNILREREKIYKTFNVRDQSFANLKC
jgi:hypothetical protein